MNKFEELTSGLALKLMSQKCYTEIFVKFSPSLDCMLAIVSKLLGFVIIAGSSIVKVPQIMKIWNNHSAQGISFLSVLTDLYAITVASSYSFLKGFPFRTYTVEEAVSLIELSDEAFRAAVYIEGVDNPLISDEDSADEDEPDANINHLSGNQMLAPAHVVIEKVVNNQIVTEEIGFEADQESVAASQPEKVVSRSWKKIDITSKSVARLVKDPVHNFSTVQLFELFFDEDIINEITNFTNNYAKEKGNMGIMICHTEIKGFIDQPCVVVQYNKFMGGVERLDQKNGISH